MVVPKWGSLSPLLQMSLSNMRPGTFVAPFVESNGTPSRTPTSVIHGEYEYNVAAIQAPGYAVIVNFPQTGYNSDAGATGIFVDDGNAAGDPVALAMGSGVVFTGVYGSSALFSRYKILSQRLDICFQAPEATITGQVFIGSLQVSAMNTATTSVLIDNATKTLDLKVQPSWELSSFLSDRSLVHETCNISNVADEWVSYAVITRSPTISISTGASNQYNLVIKAHANIIWNPLINSPVMNGIALRPPESCVPPPPLQVEMSSVCQTRASEPQPMSLPAVTRCIQMALSDRKDHGLLPGRPTAGPAAAMTSAQILDPSRSIPDYSDRFSALEFLACILRRLPEGDDEDEAILQDVMETLLRASNQWRTRQQTSLELRQKYKSCTRAVVERRGHRALVYTLPSGEIYDHRITNSNRSLSRSRDNASTGTVFTRV